MRAFSLRYPALVGALAVAIGACQPTPIASPAPSNVEPTTSPAARLPLVIDTDMAPDDLVAIASLLRDPAVDVLAITVVGTGEAHCRGGLFVARSVVTMLLDEPIPVTCGTETPFGDAEPFPDAWRAGVDAGNGLDIVSPLFAPDARPAPDLLVELAHAQVAAGSKLTILTIGTLTNIAAALELDPTLPTKVRLISMLGAVGVPGNVETTPVAPTAEWNAHADPTAVRLVLAAGFDWTLVPLDATNSVPLTGELYANLQADHAAGPADLIFELWSRNEYMTGGGYYLWDPLAAAALRDPSIVTTRRATLRVVEGSGPDGGRLVEDPAGVAVTIGTGADRARFEAFLLERLRIGPPRQNLFVPNGIFTVTAADGTCKARLDPPSARGGGVRFDTTNAGSEPVQIIAFALGSVSWPELEAFVVAASQGLASPPPVQEIRSMEIDAGSHGSWTGNAPAGQIGIACIFGSFDAPEITLAGPFTLAP